MNIERLRQQAKQKVLEVEALAVFTNQLNRENPSEIANTYQEIGKTSSKRLHQIVVWAEHHIAVLKERSGFVGDLTELIRLVKRSRANSPMVLTMPKQHVDRLFRHYDRCFPGWEALPPHAMIGIDGSGNIERTIWHGVYLPEAVLYEDMCASYNLAQRSFKRRFDPSASKVEIKTHNMAVRTAILSAYYFVEAYLNAVAFDCWARKHEQLSQDNIDMLLEWDSRKGRQRWLSLEQKANHYPKIILNVQHSPLAASNCKELDYLLTKGKIIRDAIVHASPKVDPITKRPQKLNQMFGSHFPDAVAVVNASVTYVLQLNKLLGNQGCDLSWLIERDGSGQFPDSAFA